MSVRRRSRVEVVEEVQFLLDCGEKPTGVAAHLGMRPSSVSRALYRAARPDLARLFHRGVKDRPGRCRDCGCGVSRSAARCNTCAAYERERVHRATKWGRAA